MSHSGAFTTGLTVDGMDFSNADGTIWGRLTEGFHDGMETRGGDVQVSHLDYQVPAPRRPHQRVLKYEGMVMGAGADEDAQRASFQSVRSAVFDKMRGDQDPYTIEYTAEDGSTWSIEARPLRPEWSGPELTSYRELTCYWLALEDWAAGGS